MSGLQAATIAAIAKPSPLLSQKRLLTWLRFSFELLRLRGQNQLAKMQSSSEP
jgi:hypothetical protein